MHSLKTLAIKTIIANDICCEHSYLQQIIAEFCEKHPELVPNSPQSYWKFKSSYIFLSKRTFDCNYLGPSDLFLRETTFLNDPTNLTTKFINSEFQKYIVLSHFTSRKLPINTVPFKAYFEFTDEYIKHTGSKYNTLGLETTVNNISIFNRKIVPWSLSYNFKNNVFAQHIYKYKPITFVCPEEHMLSLLRSVSSTASFKNNPIFIFNDKLQFDDEFAEGQRDCENICKPLLERIRWFRTTVHAQYMSELHFMLLDCDVTHRVLTIMTLFPTVYFNFVDKVNKLSV
jgi:hypothetical protein